MLVSEWINGAYKAWYGTEMCVWASQARTREQLAMGKGGAGRP